MRIQTRCISPHKKWSLSIDGAYSGNLVILQGHMFWYTCDRLVDIKNIAEKSGLDSVINELYEFAKHEKCKYLIVSHNPGDIGTLYPEKRWNDLGFQWIQEKAEFYVREVN